MKNTKNVLNLFVMAGLGLSFSLLTACGGSSSSSPDTLVSTIPNCTTSSIQNQTTGAWTFSATDLRECNAINTVSANVNCFSNQIRVRIPVTSNNSGFVNNGNNYQGNTGYSATFQGSINLGNSYQNNNYQNNNFQNNNYQNNNYQISNQTNYHTDQNYYTETCVDQNSQDWQYVVNAGAYYYLDYNNYYNSYQNYQTQYQYSYNTSLSTRDTLLTFGVLATALFFLSK